MTGRRVVDQMIAAFEAADLDAVGALLTDDAQVRNPFATMDREGFVAFMGAFCQAMSDRRIEVLDAVERAPVVAVELRVRTRHTGTLVMPTGEAPATGRELCFAEVGFVRLRGERIESWHSYYDALDVLGQLGLAPVSAAA